MSQDKWIERYRNSVELADETADVLTAFNANIDVIHNVEELDLEEREPELVEKVESMEDLEKVIAYCQEKGENHEIDLDTEIELEGEERLGGQAGIMSNFLANTGDGVIFYTPLLSDELSQLVNEKVLFPVIDGDFVLKNVRDASTTDRTKKNHIFEFSGEHSGRLILSDSLKGFGPYFRKGVEDNFDQIEKNIDCATLSGFHDASGNLEAKFQKAGNQLEKISVPVHLEYVHKNDDLSRLAIDHVLPEVDSLGLDETELKELSELLDFEHSDENVNLGQAFDLGKKLIERFGLQRIHLHTYRYHLLVSNESPRDLDELRRSLLYAEVAAIRSAETGEIPDSDSIRNFDFEDKHIQELEELQHFGNHFELGDFVETGTAEIDGLSVVAIPPVIHEKPARTVGMGDIISSAAFTTEFRNQ